MLFSCFKQMRNGSISGEPTIWENFHKAPDPKSFSLLLVFSFSKSSSLTRSFIEPFSASITISSSSSIKAIGPFTAASGLICPTQNLLLLLKTFHQYQCYFVTHSLTINCCRCCKHLSYQTAFWSSYLMTMTSPSEYFFHHCFKGIFCN